MKWLIRTIRVVSVLFILVFVGYVVFGEFVPLWFESREYAKVFFRWSTFLAGAGVYGLVYSRISPSKKMIINILHFLSALALGAIPMVFVYVANHYFCPFWLNYQTNYEKITSDSGIFYELNPQCTNAPKLILTHEPLWSNILFYGENIGHE